MGDASYSGAYTYNEKLVKKLEKEFVSF